MFCRIEFCFDVVTTVAKAGSLGATTLNHEAFDNSMEDDAVIETDLRERDEILGMIGRDIMKEGDADRAFIGLQLNGVVVLVEIDIRLGGIDFGFAVRFVHERFAFWLSVFKIGRAHV